MLESLLLQGQRALAAASAEPLNFGQ
jgi:hypothetical protein